MYEEQCGRAVRLRIAANHLIMEAYVIIEEGDSPEHLRQLVVVQVDPRVHCGGSRNGPYWAATQIGMRIRRFIGCAACYEWELYGHPFGKKVRMRLLRIFQSKSDFAHWTQPRFTKVSHQLEHAT